MLNGAAAWDREQERLQTRKQAHTHMHGYTRPHPHRDGRAAEQVDQLHERVAGAMGDAARRRALILQVGLSLSPLSKRLQSMEIISKTYCRPNISLSSSHTWFSFREGARTPVHTVSLGDVAR